MPDGRVSTEEAVLAAHAGDAWFAASLPEAVVFPESAEEVSALLKFASEKGVPVTPRGAGRGYVGGCVPARGGIAVSLMRMNRILEINREDGVAVAQPGVITGDLQDAVLAQGLFYPPDPASLRECSLGGNVATNAGGPRCLKYGVTRHYILGLQVVLMDGTIVRVGGRTHKNKMGLDLIGMFVGSEGLLGVVTEITVRLLPAPPASATLAASFAEATGAAAAVQAVLAHGFLPAAMEVADHFTLEAARAHLGADKVPPGNAHVILELDGQPASVRGEAASLAELLRKVGALTVKTATTPAESDAIWGLRRAFSGSLRATGLTKLNEDVTVPRSRLVDLFVLGGALQAKYGFPVACFGHAGDGNIHVNIMVDPNEPDTTTRMEAALDELFDHVVAWGGAISGEHGVGLAKKRWWLKAAPAELRRLTAMVKSALDPQSLLNPGKFV
ncbi:FAD/FMN-containing dehydrogenase [Verrucomicrobia bacterium LW23]|nr:FAD/FMN-containing dehydrogenase [Verrucomicrobia bacterium LW23]